METPLNIDYLHEEGGFLLLMRIPIQNLSPTSGMTVNQPTLISIFQKNSTLNIYTLFWHILYFTIQEINFQKLNHGSMYKAFVGQSDIRIIGLSRLP